MAGDFGQIANFTVKAGEEFIARTPIQPGVEFLMLPTAPGILAIPAARAGGLVTGVDIAPNLLEQARKRSAAGGLDVFFQEGDAEQLPYPDQSFDFVISMFGAKFAPRPERVAGELLWVCNSEDSSQRRIGLLKDLSASHFKSLRKWCRLPPGLPAPGNELAVQQRFASGVSKLTLSRQKAAFDYPFSPKGSNGILPAILRPLHRQRSQDSTHKANRSWPPGWSHCGPHTTPDRWTNEDRSGISGC